MNRHRFILRLRPCELGWLAKRLLRVDRCEHAVNGLKFWLDPSSDFGDRLLEEGHYEPEVTAAVRQLLSPGGVFVDVGANEGWFSIVAATEVGPDGMVLAVEPQDRIVPVILRNAYLNEMPWIRVAPVALGAGRGRATIRLTPSLNSGASSLVNSARSAFWPRQNVMVTPFDDLCRVYGLDFVDLVKIDVEGFELEALRGAEESLRANRIGAVIVETHARQLRRMKTTEHEIDSLLSGHGYRHTTVGVQSVWVAAESKSKQG